MSDNRAYTYQILPNDGRDVSEDEEHQSSPTWVVTVVRWANRDTFRTTIKGQNSKNISQVATLSPLIISNDCLQVTVDSNKGTLTPSFNALLKITDTNYLTSIAPGDFVFINMLNWEADADRVIQQIKDGQPINGFDDGFKGFFKVQGVRRALNVDPNSGVKTVACKLNGFAFTEFNNTIYFNPNVLNGEKDKQILLFSQNVSETFAHLVNKDGYVNVRDIIAVLIQSFIGSGPSQKSSPDVLVQSRNTQFFMPPLVGQLLNVSGVKAAKDVYSYLFGVQKYNGSSVSDPGEGFNPVGLVSRYGGQFKYTSTANQGQGLLIPEYWNCVKTWAILNQYTNAPVNELFTCFRLNQNGDVMPTVVFRQIPFSSETSDPGIPITRFMTVPRWYVSPALITDLDIGRDEAARINFVQAYTRSSFGKDGVSVSFETAEGNFQYDQDDVSRSGLRPYIMYSNFGEVSGANASVNFKGPVWAKLLGDSLIGGHLKMNGTITCIGLVDPVAVGDNLELDDTVYHIEQVSHTCSILGSSGVKTFRTVISLSSGVSISSSENGTRYAEMDYTNGNAFRKHDYKFNKLIPGISEAQKISSRTNPDVPGSDKNYSFAQPNSRIVMNKKLVNKRKKKK